MAGKLTKRTVDAAKRGETVWDGDIPGFGLRVSKGGAKSYVLKYRRAGVQRWVTIGRHGAPFTPATARQEAQRLIAELLDGKDPANEKAQKREAASLSSFAERYLKEYSELHKKASSAREEKRLLEKIILPQLGRLRVGEIERADIARVHRSLKDTPYQANRCLALLSHMFNIAQDWGVRADTPNPCLRIKRYDEEPRERFLSQEELSKLGNALNQAETADESLYVTNAIRLLVFTGARLNEILTLKWDDVDLEARLLRLSDSKTGKKSIALAAPATEILTNLPRMQNNPFVICGRNAGEHLVNLQKPWRRIRKMASLEDVRIHDLRHSFASFGAAGGMSLPLIGSLLGHTQAQTTQRYAHLADDPRLAAANAIASQIAANLNGDGGEVIPLKKGG